MKPIFFTSIIFLLFFVIRINAQTTSETFKSALTDQGVDLYNAHTYKEAIVSFNKAIKENPKDGKAFYYRGMSKMHDGQKGFCKDLEESLILGYSTSADIFYYGCETHTKK